MNYDRHLTPALIQAARFGLFLFHYLFSIRVIYAYLNGLTDSAGLLTCVTIGTTVVLVWMNTRTTLFVFLSAVPVLTGLESTGVFHNAFTLNFVFAAFYVGWFTKRCLQNGTDIFQHGDRISSLVEILCAMCLASSVIFLSRFPLDFLLYRLKFLAFDGQMDVLWSLEAGYTFMLGLFLYRILSIEIDNMTAWRKLSRVYFAQAFLIVCFSGYQLVFLKSELIYKSFGVFYPFYDIHSYGSYLLLVLFVLMGIIKRDNKLKTLTAISVMLVALVIFSGSNQTIISLALTGFILLYFSAKKKTFAVLSCSLLFVLFISNIYLKPIEVKHLSSPRIFSRSLVWADVKQRLELRMPYWSRAVGMAADYPLTGTGIGTFYRESHSFRPGGDQQKSMIFDNVHKKYENAHNYYLQMAAELGLPALFTFVIIILMVYKDGVTFLRSNKENAQTMKFILIGLSGYLITMAVSHPMLLIYHQLLFWSTLALVTTAAGIGLTKSTAIGPSRWQKTVCLGLVLLLSFGYMQPLNTGQYSTFDYGYYGDEEWDSETMRWTWERSVSHVEADTNLIGLKMFAFSHNSSGPEGLTVKLMLDGHELDKVRFIDGGAKALYYYISGLENKRHEIRTEVSRTFVPRFAGINRDPRTLGVAISPYFFLKIFPREGVGFYEPERWTGEPWNGWPVDEPIDFRWTRRRATLSLNEFKGESCTVYLMCSHPDVRENPVSVDLIGSSGVLAKKVFDNAGVFQVHLTGPQMEAISKMTVRVNRTWNPRAMNISNDDRDLGVALAMRVGGTRANDGGSTNEGNEL